MTVIVRHVTEAPPLVVRAGLVFPGLGHLLVGEWLHGVGLCALTTTFLTTVVVGLPGLGDSLFDSVTGRIIWGGFAAVTGWVGLGAALWFAAWRRAFPRVLTEDERARTASSSGGRCCATGPG